MAAKKGEAALILPVRSEGAPHRRYRFSFFVAGQPHVQVEEGRLVQRGSLNYFVHKNLSGQDVFDHHHMWHESVEAAIAAELRRLDVTMREREEKHARNMRILSRKARDLRTYEPVVQTLEESSKRVR